MADVKKYLKWVGIFLLWWVLLPVMVSVLQVLVSFKGILGVVSSQLIKRKKPLVIRTPDERFNGLEKLGYTFKPNYVDLKIGGGRTLPRVHYVDEGPRDAKETILCLHGVPSWSFLYRKMVPGFVKAGYRVIVPDFIGFGKSDKYTDMEMYSHELHTLTLRLLLEHLSISNITLVCQDWGGMTGLSVVKDMPKVFSRLVVMNTALPAGQDASLRNIGQTIPFLLWRSFTSLCGTMMPMYYLFKLALVKPNDDILNAYAAPFPDKKYKSGAAMWPLLVPLSSHPPMAVDMEATREFLKTKWTAPALIMFADEDYVTRRYAKTFHRLMPHASTKPIVAGAGHFLQEDKGPELTNHIISFIDGKL